MSDQAEMLRQEALHRVWADRALSCEVLLQRHSDHMTAAELAEVRELIAAREYGLAGVAIATEPVSDEMWRRALGEVA